MDDIIKGREGIHDLLAVRLAYSRDALKEVEACLLAAHGLVGAGRKAVALVTHGYEHTQSLIGVVKTQIRAVIVKDMSRLGRDYLQVGMYTEMVFPNNDIRFIAINNGVDSVNGTENDMTPFINIFNENLA